MRNNKLKVLALFTIMCFITSTILPVFSGCINNVAMAEDTAINELAVQAVRNNYQEFTNSDSLGAYDAYVLAKAGVDLSKWEKDGKSIKSNILDKIDETLADPHKKIINYGKEVYAISAKEIAYEYLVAEKWNEIDKANKLIEALKARQAGKGSFDNNPFSDMPAFEALGREGMLSKLEEKGKAIAYIIKDQDSTGAWSTSWKDFATTAQAVRSLFYLKAEIESAEEKTKIDESINKGLAWIKDKQQGNGSFINGEWDDPVIDTAEVIYTLQLIKPEGWENERQLAEAYMKESALNEDGTFGSTKNIVDNTYALDTYLMLGAFLAEDTLVALQVEPSTTQLVIGDTAQFSATAFSVQGENKDVVDKVEWSVVDEYIANIDSKGKVTALAPGGTTVEATYQGIKATADLTVDYKQELDEQAVQAVRQCYNAYQTGEFLSTYDTYILTKVGIDLSKWQKEETDLKESILAKIDETMKEPNKKADGKYVISAKEMAHEYLMAQKWGETDKATTLVNALVARQSEDGSLDNNIYSDMPAFAALGRGGAISRMNDQTVTNIVYSQGKDGSWGGFEPTTQAVRSLHYLLKEEAISEDEKEKADKSRISGLNWMEQQQQDDGSFTVSSEWNGNIYWEDKLIDSTEVVRTIKTLNEDKFLAELKEELHKWNKKGKSVIDYMTNDSYQQGKFGDYGTVMDTTCALDAYSILGAEIPDNVAVYLKVEPGDSELSKGGTQQYKATVYCMDNYEGRDVTDKVNWSVAEETIAEINEMGFVTTRSAGGTEIKATYHGLVGTAALVVKDSGGGGGEGGNEKGVKVIVTGKGKKELYNKYVQLSKSKMNALEALKATGLSVKTHPDNRNFVISVEGQANEGSKGWMCKINGGEISDTADKAKVVNGDKVEWWYSETPPAGGGIEKEELQEETGVASDDQILVEALQKKGEALLDLAQLEDGKARLSLDIVKELSNADKNLIIKKDDVRITFAPGAFLTKQYEEALKDETSRIEISAKEVSSTEKRRIFEKAGLGDNTGLFSVGGKMFDFTAQITHHSQEQEKKETSPVTEKITEFNNLVKISVDLSELDLTGEEILQLTAVRFEKDKQGNIKPIKLGGDFDYSTYKFTFYTDTFSLYSVVRAENLIKIKIGLNDSYVSVSGDIIMLDVPAEVIEGHTMVPLRFIAESLGTEVQWLSDMRAAEIKAGDKTLRLFVEQKDDNLKGVAIIRKGRILVPLRYVVEELDCHVKWFSDSKRIEIIK